MSKQAQHNDGTIHITRTFDAPRAKVWKAWTDPDEMKKWWGPESFTSPFVNIDLKVGGKYLYCMRGPDNKDYWSTGVYREIVPMERLVCTDHFADKNGNIVSPLEYGMPGDWPDEMEVTITFADAGKGKTTMTMVHVGHPVEMKEMASLGWNQSLDKLAALLM